MKKKRNDTHKIENSKNDWSHKPDDYKQWQLEFENRKHETNGYLIHIPLGLRKRLFYFRTVYMYTIVRVYVLYCTYIFS